MRVSKPKPFASGAVWQGNGSTDFLQLKDIGGTVIGWIDANGVLQGSLALGGGVGVSALNTLTGDVTLAVGAGLSLTPSGNTLTLALTGGGGSGFGFAFGAIVAGSTGNVPPNGFSITNGSGNSAEVDPTGFQWNSAVGTIILDATSSQFSVNSSSGPTVTIDGTVPSTTWDDGAGNTVVINPANSPFQVEVVDASGNSGSLGSTEITLSNTAGDSITLNAGNQQLDIAAVAGPALKLSSGVAPGTTAGQLGIGTTHQATVGGAGGASPQPVTPLGYLLWNVEGTVVAIPYHKAS